MGDVGNLGGLIRRFCCRLLSVVLVVLVAMMMKVRRWAFWIGLDFWR